MILFRFTTGVAAAIRAGVQNARAACCAAALTVLVAAIPGADPPVDVGPPVDASATPPSAVPVASEAAINAVTAQR
jgi:hypothetical protein